MSREVKRNLPASVRQRLLTKSQEQGEPFDLVLTRYGIERLLYRLSQSPHAGHFLLKGAMLFRIWTDVSHRPTRDVDLLGTGPAEVERLVEIFREICTVPVEPDGLEFVADSVKAHPIREEAFYDGIRVNIVAQLGNARIPIQVDSRHQYAGSPPCTSRVGTMCGMPVRAPLFGIGTVSVVVISLERAFRLG